MSEFGHTEKGPSIDTEWGKKLGDYWLHEFIYGSEKVRGERDKKWKADLVITDARRRLQGKLLTVIMVDEEHPQEVLNGRFSAVNLKDGYFTLKTGKKIPYVEWQNLEGEDFERPVPLVELELHEDTKIF